MTGIGLLCDTSKYQMYDIKDGCEAGDDVWTGDSSDDKETGEADVAEMRMPRFNFHGSDKEGQY